MTARWGVQGWPPLVGWAEHPDLPALYWALHEIGPASTARDFDVLDDLLAEVALWLDRILARPAPVGPVGHADLAPVLTLLWGELQMGRGAEDVVQMGVNASLMQKVTAPPAAGAARPAHAVPPYVASAHRIRGGGLPLVVDRPVAAADRPAHERFLLELGAVLSNSGGHLTDHHTLACPRGASPARTGWRPGQQGPAGELLGSIQVLPESRRTLLLRPQVCIRAVNAAGAGPTWNAREVGRGLAGAWLVDTTLIVDDRVERVDTAAAAVIDDDEAEPLWQLPLTVFHPHQFFPPADPARRPRGSLRAVPDQ